MKERTNQGSRTETSAMSNLTATVPHKLTRDEAKRRIQDQLGQLRQQQGQLLQNLQETWTGDRMDFSVAAMGQTVTGHLVVEDQAVQVEVALPWMLAMLAG